MPFWLQTLKMVLAWKQKTDALRQGKVTLASVIAIATELYGGVPGFNKSASMHGDEIAQAEKIRAHVRLI